ncbi:MAG: GNAT family N-acetyltransferase [Acetobacteraceae bacterium]|nr:GNAT family N-acetyltransferase [Acetobacteraceae bacterium]
MTGRLLLETSRGPIALRPEQDGDRTFLYDLFCSHVLPDIARLPIDDSTRDALVGMQFISQTTTYRTQFPQARFDIIEREGVPIGRLVVDDAGDVACIVDFALLPGVRGSGMGSAILACVLAPLGERGRAVRSTVVWNNEASLRMCRRLGFVHIGGDPPFMQLEWHAGAGSGQPVRPFG